MTPTGRLSVAVVLTAMAGGCAYYNGLYNANRIANDATRAEREGRPGEASALWAQAAVKAESVLARYPKSSHRDDALLLQGRALFGSDRCRAAVAPLVIAVDSSPDRAIRERAGLILGQCRLQLGRRDEALEVFSRLVDADDPAIVRAALLWRGQAFMAVGDDERAVRDLAASEMAEASFSLALAYGRLRQPERAVHVLLGQLSGRYVERSWLATLDSLGARYPSAAAVIVDSLARRRTLTPGQRARLLLDDGARWEKSDDTERAAARFAAAWSAAPDSVEGAHARARRLLAEVRLANELERIPALLDSLESLPGSGSPGSPAEPTARALRRAATVLWSDSAGGTDLEMFVAAELLRDSLGARSLAAALFREIPRRRPGSAIAPKALLAAALIDSIARDSLISLVELQYPASPYALALRGLAGSAYTAIEDSLFTLLGGHEADAGLRERDPVRRRAISDTAQSEPLARRP